MRTTLYLSHLFTGTIAVSTAIRGIWAEDHEQTLGGKFDRSFQVYIFSSLNRKSCTEECMLLHNVDSATDAHEMQGKIETKRISVRIAN
jgi:hypothetical protein